MDMGEYIKQLHPKPVTLIDRTVGDMPQDVELPNPQNSIDHADVAPIEEVNYDDASKSA